jgi:nucleotide-binding universal stress UspA family protein
VLNNILVPLDGSALSEAALPHAQALAKRTGAALTLVRAAHRSASPLADAAIDTQRAVAEAEEYLESLSTKLSSQGFNVQTGVPFGGSAAAWIVEEISLRQADLVVMATHDRIGPDRWVHGSVAEAVVHRGDAPVMLIRATDQPQANHVSDAQPALIVPLDGSELAEAVLPLAADLARQIGASVVLLAVIPRPGQLVAAEGGIVTYVSADHARIETEAEAYLEACVGRVGCGGSVSVETLVRLGEPAIEIAATAQERSAAAVVMATHGRTGLVRSILGSVAGGVLHRSTTPVVLTRPHELRPAEEPIKRQAAAAAAG